MLMKARFTILLATIPCFLFALPKGDICITSVYSYYSSDHFWNSDGKKRFAHNDFEKKEYQLQVEYGLTNKDTLSLKGGWARIDESVNGRTFGFEDISISWKRLLGQKFCYCMSGEIIAIIPVENEYEPGLRYGQYGAEISFHFFRDYKFCNRNLIHGLSLGYRKYDGFPSDQIRLKTWLCYNLWQKLQLFANTRLDYGLFNGRSRNDASLFLFNPNYRLLSLDVGADLSLFKCLKAFIGYKKHIWGQNVGTGGFYFGGLNFHF